MRNRRGTTLLEILVAIAIISIAIALLISGVQKVRDAAQRMSCSNRLRQVALAAHHFESIKHRFPAGCEYRFEPFAGLKGHDFGFSWQSALLPFLEQEALGRQAEANYVLDPGGNNLWPFMSSSVPALICPADGRTTIPFKGFEVGTTYYIGVAGTRIGRDDGILDCDSRVRFVDIRDGSSHTVMIGERPPGVTAYGMGTWYSGTGFSLCPYGKILPAGVNDYIDSDAQNCTLDSDAPLRPGKLDDCHTGHFWSLHAGGANFAFAYGSVKFLAYSASPILPALASRAGGEVVEVP